MGSAVAIEEPRVKRFLRRKELAEIAEFLREFRKECAANAGTNFLIEPRLQGQCLLALFGVGGIERRIRIVRLQRIDDRGRPGNDKPADLQDRRLGRPREFPHRRRMGPRQIGNPLVRHALEVERPAGLLVVMRMGKLMQFQRDVIRIHGPVLPAMEHSTAAHAAK